MKILRVFVDSNLNAPSVGVTMTDDEECRSLSCGPNTEFDLCVVDVAFDSSWRNIEDESDVRECPSL